MVFGADVGREVDEETDEEEVAAKALAALAAKVEDGKTAVAGL